MRLHPTSPVIDPRRGPDPAAADIARHGTRAAGARPPLHAWRGRPRRRAAYGGTVTTCQTSATEPCPQCGEADLRPYGNGSKWSCPRCFFVLPCC